MLPNVAVHVIQRGNNRQACFFQLSDYQRYLGYLHEFAAASGCTVHAFVLMTNHVHLLLTPATRDATAILMKRLGQNYVQYVNRRYARSGTLWEGRYKSCLVGEERYVLGCYRYIELNPVRAGMVSHPAEYPWSSYRANGQDEAALLLTPHRSYLDLGNDRESRKAAYRDLFESQLEAGMVDQIRQATAGNFVLGTRRFEDRIGQLLGRRVVRSRPGRPAKSNQPG